MTIERFNFKNDALCVTLNTNFTTKINKNKTDYYENNIIRNNSIYLYAMYIMHIEKYGHDIYNKHKTTIPSVFRTILLTFIKSLTMRT